MKVSQGLLNNFFHKVYIKWQLMSDSSLNTYDNINAFWKTSNTYNTVQLVYRKSTFNETFHVVSSRSWVTASHHHHTVVNQLWLVVN